MPGIAEYLSKMYGSDQEVMADAISQVTTIGEAGVAFFTQSNVAFTAADVMSFVECVMEAMEHE